MGLKILHSADWHLDSPFLSFREDQRAALKRAQQLIPQKIAEIARREDCGLVLLAGDLFDGAWNRDTLDRARQALKDCGCPVMIAPGNHDPWGPDSPWQESWPDNVHIFRPGISSVYLKDLDTRVYGSGFSGMDCESILSGFHAEKMETYQIGVFHGDPTNGNSPYNPVTTAEIRQSGLTYLALGHVHSAGGLEVENTVCSWSGCPMGRGWDETGSKGCLLAEIEEQVRVRTIPMDLPEFYRETVDVEGREVPDLDGVLPPAGCRNFYRITLEGYGKPDLTAIRQKYQNFLNLELLDQTVDPQSLWTGMEEDSLRGAYLKRLKEAADQADPELQHKILLAAEISQKLLEGREVQLP